MSENRHLDEPQGLRSTGDGTGEDRADRLRWQSRGVLLLVLPTAGVWLAVLLLRLSALSGWPTTLVELVPGALLALAVVWARAATPAGALTGGLLMACFCLTTPGWRSSAWPLLAMLILTLSATRVGRARKQQLGTAESSHGRDAAQVAANLGMAALAGTLIDAQGQVYALTAMLAALAEAGADTLASELGQALRGTPRLITTLRPVAPGTDGGITLAGTGLGALGALVIAVLGVVAMPIPWASAWIAAVAGTAGLLFDSLLGATLEQNHNYCAQRSGSGCGRSLRNGRVNDCRSGYTYCDSALERAGWLNNDAVNFLSTVFAAAVALALCAAFR